MEHGLLSKKYPTLASSHPVERAVAKARRKGDSIADTKAKRIDAYLARLERIIATGRGWNLLKHKIVQGLALDVTDEDTLQKIAYGLYTLEKKRAIEQGRGADIAPLEETDNLIDKYRTRIHETHSIQAARLTTWLEYLKQNDAPTLSGFGTL